MASVEILDDPPNLEDALRRLASRRAWLIRALMLALTVIVAGVVVGQALWPNVVAFFHPTTYDLYLAINVNWGTVTIAHGGQVTRRDLSASGAPVFHLTQNAQPYRVAVTVDTPPFSTKGCWLTIPPAGDDTCQSVNGVSSFGNSQKAVDVAFAFTLNDLAPGLRSDVQALVTAQLFAAQPQTTIAAGSHYATGGALGKRIMVADLPIIATLITKPVNDETCSENCFPSESACTGHCVAPRVAQLDIWRMRIFVIQDWRFTRAAGGGNLVGSTDENDVPHPLDLVLLYNSVQQRWEPPPADLGLTAALTAVEAELCYNGQGYVESLFFQSAPSLTQFEPTPQTVDHQLAGCLYLVPATDPHHPTADFLWRFGQLYAANDIAVQADSSLPIASPADLMAFADD